MITHGFTERYSGEQIVVVILERHGHRLPDSFQPCKMDNTVDIILFKDGVKGSPVTDVIFIKHKIFSRDLLDAFQRFFTGIYQVVYNNDSVSFVQKFNACMAADKSGTAGDENVHSISPLSQVRLWDRYPGYAKQL